MKLFTILSVSLSFAAAIPSGSTLVSSSQTVPTPSSTVTAGGYRNVAYFVNWGVYEKKYFVSNITTASDITHLLYAFANFTSDGTVMLSDSYADVEGLFSGDASGSGNNLHGNTNAIYNLKQQHRNVKSLLSIGGWTYSLNNQFSIALNSPEKRSRFVSSAVSFVKDLGFDGVDIDWEYPQDDIDATNYVLLLTELRQALDQYSASNANGQHFEITIASPAGPTHYNIMHLKEMAGYLDAFHLMAYDYAGAGFSSVTGDQANLYKSTKIPSSTQFSTDQAIKDYIQAGVPASKIVVGLGLYGRQFEGTQGLGTPFTGAGPGQFAAEAGIWNYNMLPKAGAVEFYDEETVASGSYDSQKQEFLTYDTATVIQKKVEYVKDNKLGGTMFWELSGDKNGDQSLVAIAAKGLGMLQESQNCLKYPQSKYDNIRSSTA